MLLHPPQPGKSLFMHVEESPKQLCSHSLTDNYYLFRILQDAGYDVRVERSKQRIFSDEEYERCVCPTIAFQY